MASLVMQMGGGNSEDSGSALDVLASLVDQHLVAMAPFAVFFKVIFFHT